MLSEIVAGPAVAAHDITVRYAEQIALDHVTLSIPTGQLVAVVGPNGAGKSTLFKALVGLAPLASGEVALLGKPARERHPSDVSYIAQRGEIDWRFPVRVEDVVLMGRYPHLGWGRRPSAVDRDQALAALDRVGLADLAKRQIGQLSGGQQQRVFLARALTQEAKVLLLDEPFTGIDVVAEQIMFDILADMQAEGRTILVATHDLNTVVAHFSSVIALNRRLVAYGSTAQVFTPEVLSQAYGGQLVMVPMAQGTAMAIGDPCGHFG
jgi:manganese/zinc/iron transport system ATP- binding protein